MRNRLAQYLWCLLAGAISTAAYGQAGKLDEAWQAYCAGELPRATQLLDEQSFTDPSAGFEAAYLRSRIAASTFTAFYFGNEIGGRTLTAEEARQKRELSSAVTKAYEEAFQAAPDRYTKACMTAEWWPMNAHYQFADDSALLMSGSPQALAADVSPSLADKIEAQKRLFRAVLRGALDVGPSTQDMVRQDKDAFAEALAGEFARLAVIDVPDDVFADVLRCIPVYVHDYMTPPQDLPDASLYRHTMRWHLWGAMTRRPPNPVEQEVIQRQTSEFAEVIAKAMDENIVHPKVKPRGEYYSQLSLRTYERLHDNAFVPYFKRWLPEYELLKRQEILRESITQTADSWRQGVDGWEHGREPEPDSTYERMGKVYQDTIYFLTWGAFTHYRQPTWEGMLPTEYIQLSQSSLNKNAVFTITVRRVLPWPLEQEQPDTQPAAETADTRPAQEGEAPRP